MKGIYCPSITIFDKENNLDINANKEYWKRLIKEDIDGVLILGTIGENTELTISEKESLIKAANSTFSDTPKKLIVGCSSVLINESISLTQLCNDMPSVSAVLSMPAFYFGLTQESVKNHMSKVCNISTKPVIAYNFPDRNGIDISIETLKFLKSNFANFSGVKNTSKNVESTMIMIKELEDENFTVYSGFDEHYMPTLISGGSSIISGLVNLIPSAFAKMKQANDNKELDGIVGNHKEVIELLSVYHAHPHFVAAIKNELKKAELISNNSYRGIY